MTFLPHHITYRLLIILSIFVFICTQDRNYFSHLEDESIERIDASKFFSGLFNSRRGLPSRWKEYLFPSESQIQPTILPDYPPSNEFNFNYDITDQNLYFPSNSYISQQTYIPSLTSQSIYPMESNINYVTVKPRHPYRGFDKSTKRSRSNSSKNNEGPTISISGAPGGGTAIKFGKAQITFKKGSISLGAAEDRPLRSSRSKKLKRINKSPDHSPGMSIKFNRGTGGKAMSISFGGESSSTSPDKIKSASSSNYDNVRLPAITFGNGGISIGGGDSSYSSSSSHGYHKRYPARPRLKLKLPHFPKTYIESNLKLPPIRVKLHASPRVKITTGTKDPLAPKPIEEDPNMQDIFKPPLPFPKPSNNTEKNTTIPIFPYPPYPPYFVPISHGVYGPNYLHYGHDFIPNAPNYPLNLTNYVSNYPPNEPKVQNIPHYLQNDSPVGKHYPYSGQNNQLYQQNGPNYSPNYSSNNNHNNNYNYNYNHQYYQGHQNSYQKSAYYQKYQEYRDAHKASASSPSQKYFNPNDTTSSSYNAPVYSSYLPPGSYSDGYNRQVSYSVYKPKKEYGKTILKYDRATDDKAQIILDLKPKISFHRANDTEEPKPKKHKNPFFKLKLNPIFLNTTNKKHEYHNRSYDYGYGQYYDFGYGYSNPYRTHFGLISTPQPVSYITTTKRSVTSTTESSKKETEDEDDYNDETAKRGIKKDESDDYDDYENEKDDKNKDIDKKNSKRNKDDDYDDDKDEEEKKEVKNSGKINDKSKRKDKNMKKSKVKDEEKDIEIDKSTNDDSKEKDKNNDKKETDNTKEKNAKKEDFKEKNEDKSKKNTKNNEYDYYEDYDEKGENKKNISKKDIDTIDKKDDSKGSISDYVNQDEEKNKEDVSIEGKIEGKAKEKEREKDKKEEKRKPKNNELKKSEKSSLSKFNYENTNERSISRVSEFSYEYEEENDKNLNSKRSSHKREEIALKSTSSKSNRKSSKTKAKNKSEKANQKKITSEEKTNVSDANIENNTREDVNNAITEIMDRLKKVEKVSYGIPGKIYQNDTETIMSFPIGTKYNVRLSSSVSNVEGVNSQKKADEIFIEPEALRKILIMMQETLEDIKKSHTAPCPIDDKKNLTSHIVEMMMKDERIPEIMKNIKSRKKLSNQEKKNILSGIMIELGENEDNENDYNDNNSYKNDDSKNERINNENKQFMSKNITSTEDVPIIVVLLPPEEEDAQQENNKSNQQSNSKAS